MNANEDSAKSALQCTDIISSISEFAADVQNSFESVSDSKVVVEEVNCLIENLEDFQIKAYDKPIKVGFQRVHDQYKTLEDNIYYAAKALNHFLKLNNSENENFLIEEAGRVPTSIQGTLDLIHNKSNLLIGIQYNYDVSTISILVAYIMTIFFYILIQCDLV